MLTSILQALQAEETFQEIVSALSSGTPLSNLRLPRAARGPVLAALQQTLRAPILYLTHRGDHAITLADELRLWLPDEQLLLFPEPDALFYENAPWGANTRRDRLAVLTTLASQLIPGARATPPPAPLIICPIRAAMTRTMPRRIFIKSVQKLQPGQIILPHQLSQHWVTQGYEPVSTVTEPGQFARRGGILDVWPPAEHNPTRIEFFGDEIDTLRYFDPNTQRTTQHHQQLHIAPAREFTCPEGYDLTDEGKLTEFHIPQIFPHPGRVFDYLPRNAFVLMDDADRIQENVQAIEEQALSLRENCVAEGLLEADSPVPYLTYDQIEDSLLPGRTLYMGPSAATDGELPPLASQFTPNQRFGGRLKPFMEKLAQAASAGEISHIVSRQTARLVELWEEDYRPSTQIIHAPQFINGTLTEGWLFEATDGTKTHLLTDGEIFGWQRPRPRRRLRATAEAPEAAYADLENGDWIVHVDHGVGQFVGLVQRAIAGAEREYLCVEYAEGDRLFVPVQQADRMTRYIGPDSRLPTPTRLGSTQWANVKSRVKKAVAEMADELLELYAERQIVTGHAFNPDTPWQRELEASFPYVETEDQLETLKAVKADMEAERPMDRLICGDVGFGKTEIALRAAFKAVMDGKQVAMLVPTTVLAQQHYHTFRERLSAFPVEVEMLSRFRSPQQQSNILFRLAQGAVDIVIGTHRLISGDIEFKDLGLLIIDEEQRFGVTHKEKLKQLRTEVDVLTLTATPIPRTLYFALTGLRDISTLNTPPEERLPIITHVGPFSKAMIRRAIIRELERGGQVFFVHNRVQTIATIQHMLAQLVPAAKVAIAHGQMPETQLAKRMRQFTEAEIDVLLSTSIIESGLDIPNANTLIVDRADTFGLAQLYQLRGRVGRGAQRAYAYFFRPKDKRPTPEGSQRLETIAENVQLGAGFSIAMRDLEIRGAGDILGTRQHGYIASVGFHLYTRLLAEAVKHTHTEHGLPTDAGALYRKVHAPLVLVDLPLHTTIPGNYVPDLDMRLKLYRRVADAQNVAEIDQLTAEFEDRFGTRPEAVENLMLQTKVKLLAGEAGLSSVSQTRGQVVLQYPEGVTPPRVTSSQLDVRVGKSALWLKINAPFREYIHPLIDFLQELP